KRRLSGTVDPRHQRGSRPGGVYLTMSAIAMPSRQLWTPAEGMAGAPSILTRPRWIDWLCKPWIITAEGKWGVNGDGKWAISNDGECAECCDECVEATSL